MHIAYWRASVLCEQFDHITEHIMRHILAAFRVEIPRMATLRIINFTIYIHRKYRPVHAFWSQTQRRLNKHQPQSLWQEKNDSLSNSKRCTVPFGFLSFSSLFIIYELETTYGSYRTSFCCTQLVQHSKCLLFSCIFMGLLAASKRSMVTRKQHQLLYF